MRFDLIRSVALAASLAAPVAATAQYNQGMQPYNPQDPQNYGAPAAQSYGTQYPQQGQPQYPQQQPQYGAPQGQYAQQPYPQGAYPDQAAQYPQGGQEQIYQAPPALPEYDQPPAPGEGYIWTPGYWAFGPSGYYWVPGAWVAAPYDGALWTPGYWGDGPQGYFWNTGYWGPEVGFYGGINYGFGYFGLGFCGGYWRDHRFWYNREYSRVGLGFRNVYSARVNGVSSVRPGGRSFSTASAPRGAEFRGGSYNGANAGAGRGFASPGQAGMGHPAYPGSTYSGMNRGVAAPIQRPMVPMAAPRTQTFNGGGYARPAAPSAPHYSAPSAPHYSAPSGGGSHGGGGGGQSSGGGSHGGGGRR
jgi:WXXGXW repeat (2 copies)